MTVRDAERARIADGADAAGAGESSWAVVLAFAVLACALCRARLGLPELAPKSSVTGANVVVALLSTRAGYALAVLTHGPGTARVGSERRAARTCLPDASDHAHAIRASKVRTDILEVGETVTLRLALAGAALGRNVAPADDASALALASDTSFVQRAGVRRRARLCGSGADEQCDCEKGNAGTHFGQLVEEDGVLGLFLDCLRRSQSSFIVSGIQ